MSGQHSQPPTSNRGPSRHQAMSGGSCRSATPHRGSLWRRLRERHALSFSDNDDVTERAFPLEPTSVEDLDVGDFWGVPFRTERGLSSRSWNSSRGGRAHREALDVGVLDWRGSHPPQPDDVTGHRVIDHGVTGAL